jgi:chorismate synthase
MKGSEHNDAFIPKQKQEGEKFEEKKIGDDVELLSTKSNNSGGILGGISSGENIVISRILIYH